MNTQHFLIQWKLLHVGPENIITSYYQITKVFASMLSVRQHAERKDEKK